MSYIRLIESGIIPIYKSQKGSEVVSARELYKFLELAEGQFSRWAKANIVENAFASENEDWAGFDIDVEGNVVKDYALKIPFAKKLCMISKTEKGEQIRRYFIQVEEKFKKQSIDTSALSPQTQLVLQLAQSIASQELAQKQMQSELSAVKENFEVVRDTLAIVKDDWRKWVRDTLNKIAYSINKDKPDFEAIRSESYQLLEREGNCKLEIRVNNLKGRMAVEGASKSKIKAIGKIDAIEDEPRLKRIYSSIIEHMAIKHMVKIDKSA